MPGSAPEKMNYYVYILTSGRNGTFYVGVTNDLVRRVYEHKHGLIAGFTKKYNIKTLVYFELHEDITQAIQREKLIKRWSRAIKYQAISRMNPDWRDLYGEITK